MPPVTKHTKERIIEVSYNIMKEEGIEAINARRIAKELKSSVQPIFSNFENMDDLKNQLYEKAINEFYEFITKQNNNNIPPYKQIGINYIKFAKEEPILFKTLFMQEKQLDITGFVNMHKNFSLIKKIISNTTKLSDDEVKSFHIKMWLFVHGIATLIAKNTLIFTDEQISELLSSEFQALMLLEENPNNKWILPKGGN